MTDHPKLVWLRPGTDAPQLCMKKGDVEMTLQLTWNQTRDLHIGTAQYLDLYWQRIFLGDKSK